MPADRSAATRFSTKAPKAAAATELRGSAKRSQSTREVALGFSVHTGWAVVLAVAGPATEPRALLRRRIELATTPHNRFAYHAAAELNDLAAAERHVAHVRAGALALGTEALATLAAHLPKPGKTVAAGIVLGNKAPPDDLEAILRAHPLLHTAEGALFRDALARACAARRLPVHGVPMRELHPDGAATLGLQESALPAWLEAARGDLKRPWGKDEKDALLVAALALAAAGRRAPR